MLKNFNGLRRVLTAKRQFRIYARQIAELHNGVLAMDASYEPMSHPIRIDVVSNICTVYDVGEQDGRAFMLITFDVPGEGTGSQGVTAVNSINEEGAVVGWYVDGNGAYHGFIYRYRSEDD